jgi:putative transcriptional regulator
VTGPIHHPGEELLVGYAAGALPGSLELLVAAHLVYCPQCRGDVAALEAFAGDALLASAAGAPAPMGAALRAALDAPRAPHTSTTPSPPTSALPELARVPRLLQARVPPGARWTGWAPGFREIPLLADGGPPIRLVRIAPGAVTPLHTHEGQERTLVIAGELTDDEPLRTGDLAVRGADVRHAHVVTSPDPCLCLVANDAWLVPLTLRGRLFRWISDRIG